MGLFARREERAISYQDLWGSDQDWSPPGSYRTSDALQMSAVISCIRLRANTIAQMPLTSFREGADGTSVPAARQPLLIVKPSPTVSRSAWLTQMSISRDLWGYAAGLITSRTSDGFAATVEWLPPAELSTTPTTYAKWPVFSFNGRKLDPRDVIVIPSTFVLPGNPLGLAPLERTGLVDLNKKARDFGADWFRNGAVPSSVISTPETLTQEQADAMADRAASKWRRRKPAVMGSGMTIEVLKMNAEESQFLETLRHVQVDICQSFGVPPEKVGIATSGSSVTYSNREQQQSQFLIDGINADLVAIQESLTEALPRPQFVRFNTAALLRSDIGSRFNAYEVGIRSGVMTPNEARRLEDWQPIDGGDTPGGLSNE